MKSCRELEDDIFLHCTEKCSAQLFRKKDHKFLSCKVWTNTIDFHIDFKYNGNQRCLSWREGKTTKPNWSEEGNVILLILFTYRCRSILMYRSLGSKARLLMYVRVQLRTEVTQQKPDDTPVLSNVCLTCSLITLLILQEMESWLRTVPGKGDRQGWFSDQMSQKMLTGVSSGSQSRCKVTFPLCKCH